MVPRTMSSMGGQSIQPYALSLPGSTSGAHRVLTRALSDPTEHATGPGKQTVSIGFHVAHAHQGLCKYLKLRQPHGADGIVMEGPYARTQGEWERAASGHFKQDQVDLIHRFLSF